MDKTLENLYEWLVVRKGSYLDIDDYYNADQIELLRRLVKEEHDRKTEENVG